MYLDIIVIYTDNDGDRYVIAIWYILEQLKKFSLYVNLKKCQFYQE